MTTPPTLILGLGNPLRGEDGLGPALIGRLAASWENREVALLSVHQLLPEHCELLRDAERVLFIDASLAISPGDAQLTPVSRNATAAPFTHVLTPASLLALTAAVYGRAPQAWQLQIGAARFEGDCDPGDSLLRKADRLIAEFARLAITPSTERQHA
jgi:hydrogenase maturation protease